jgi:hypothetical protein
VSALSSARVRYLVVGGVAVIEHTEPQDLAVVERLKPLLRKARAKR